MSKACIGIFDSGVGGFTVLKRIKDILPKENLTYFADNYNSPYGDKEVKEIELLCLKIADFLIKKNAKLIVIACNTATVASLESIKRRFPQIPVVGVIESGAIFALNTTVNLNIGVIATPLTISTNAYQKEISKKNNNAIVYQVACKELCPMIESDWDSYENRLVIVENYINLLPKNIDTLVLGCTHYPVIIDDIKKYFFGKLVDPAIECSKKINSILKEKNILNSSNEEGEISFFVSGDTEKFKTIGKKIMDIKMNMVKKIVFTIFTLFSLTNFL